MSRDELSEAEKVLLDWFSARPKVSTSSHEMREASELIWKRPYQDAPRVARSLWEKGFLERTGGKDPYWYEPNLDHDEVAKERQRLILEKTVKTIESHLLKLSEYASRPGLLPQSVAENVNAFCDQARSDMKRLKLID